MVGVRGVTGGVATGPGRQVRSSGGGFRLGGTGGSSAAAAAQAASAPQGIGLLALQETTPPGERDARARKRGQELVEELSALQLALLSGRADPARLRRLATLTVGEAAADPGLAAAVAGLQLRARVELARLGLSAD